MIVSISIIISISIHIIIYYCHQLNVHYLSPIIKSINCSPINYSYHHYSNHQSLIFNPSITNVQLSTNRIHPSINLSINYPSIILIQTTNHRIDPSIHPSIAPIFIFIHIQFTHTHTHTHTYSSIHTHTHTTSILSMSIIDISSISNLFNQIQLIINSSIYLLNIHPIAPISISINSNQSLININHTHQSHQLSN